MSSGVQLSDDAYTAFGKVKMGKNHRYMTMVINGGSIETKAMVERGTDQKADYDEMLENLPKKSCCFIVLDMSVKNRSGGEKQALFIISWCPDTADIKEKMVYAASKDALNKIKEGCCTKQANDLSDLDYEELMELGAKK